MGPLAAPDCARQVRCGPNYPKYGKKAPSGAALGVVEAIDIFRTERRISHSLALGHIALPPATPGWSETYPEFLVITQVGGRQQAPRGAGSLGVDLTPYPLLLTPYSYSTPHSYYTAHAYYTPYSALLATRCDLLRTMRSLPSVTSLVIAQTCSNPSPSPDPNLNPNPNANPNANPNPNPNPKQMLPVKFNSALMPGKVRLRLGSGQG
jgi:hypothetical protein